jgi:hypothetical protein
MQDIVEEVLKHRSVYVTLVSDTDVPSRILSVCYNYELACAMALRDAVRELKFSFYDPLQRFVQSRSLRWSSWEDGQVVWEDRWVFLRGVSLYTVEEWLPGSSDKKAVMHCNLDRYVKRLASSGKVKRAELAERFLQWKAWAASDDSIGSVPELLATWVPAKDPSLQALHSYGTREAWRAMWAEAARDPSIPEADRKLWLWA